MNLIARQDKQIFLKELAIIDRDIPILRRRCLTLSIEITSACKTLPLLGQTGKKGL
jgi:hypothetical protein